VGAVGCNERVTHGNHCGLVRRREMCPELLLAVGEVQIVDINRIQASAALKKDILRIVMPLQGEIAFDQALDFPRLSATDRLYPVMICAIGGQEILAIG